MRMLIFLLLFLSYQQDLVIFTVYVIPFKHNFIANVIICVK